MVFNIDSLTYYIIDEERPVKPKHLDGSDEIESEPLSKEKRSSLENST